MKITLFLLTISCSFSVTAQGNLPIETSGLQPRIVTPQETQYNAMIPPGTFYQVFVGQLTGNDHRIQTVRLSNLLQHLGFLPVYIQAGGANTAFVGFRTEEEQTWLLQYHHRIFAQRTGTFHIYERDVAAYEQHADLGPTNPMTFEMPENNPIVTQMPTENPRFIPQAPLENQMFIVQAHNVFNLNMRAYIAWLNENRFFPRVIPQPYGIVTLGFDRRSNAERFLVMYPPEGRATRLNF